MRQTYVAKLRSPHLALTAQHSLYGQVQVAAPRVWSSSWSAPCDLGACQPAEAIPLRCLAGWQLVFLGQEFAARSEERRVGKGWSRGWLRALKRRSVELLQ